MIPLSKDSLRRIFVETCPPTGRDKMASLYELNNLQEVVHCYCEQEVGEDEGAVDFVFEAFEFIDFGIEGID